jgi:hypothetical protein
MPGQRIVDVDDIVTVEYQAADGSTVKQSFQMGRDIPDPRRRPFPLFDQGHLWHEAVIGRKVGEEVRLSADSADAVVRKDAALRARILEARLPEPEEVATP